MYKKKRMKEKENKFNKELGGGLGLLCFCWTVYKILNVYLELNVLFMVTILHYGTFPQHAAVKDILSQADQISQTLKCV